MIVCRTFTLLFLMCITACGVCSSLFPLFRRKYYVDQVIDNITTPYHRQETVYYWYEEVVISGSYPTLAYNRTYNSGRACHTNKMYFVVSAALSTAGAGLSGLATIMSATWVYAGFDSCLHSFIVFVTFLAFACYVVVVALVSFSYTTDTCKDSVNKAVALKKLSPSFNIVEGFILLCIAAGGLLICLVLECLAFCMCTSTDDYRGGKSKSRAIEPVVGSTYSAPSYKSESGLSRSSSNLSRSRGEISMSRRDSLSSGGSSGSSQSSASSRSSRSTSASHRHPLSRRAH